MAKILLAINLAKDHQWSIPMASLLPQALTPTAQLHVTETQERHEKSPKKMTSTHARLLGGTPYILPTSK